MINFKNHQFILNYINNSIKASKNKINGLKAFEMGGNNARSVGAPL